ncbi:sphingomyelin phosphodiesterase [Streptomyces sp. P38-E01]|uniref:Sphingomyelin phosphodiesterase n=1 Tax=Streptomyces tardus TaxID=2780544 RepID=A0A949JKW8_9ACTN|nr:sphingomyelin phosphodiesterase [Streptomyces tardus]MBU7600658.1 sphingomyelin phosphodiesterase [Streptomyces tardus]
MSHRTNRRKYRQFSGVRLAALTTALTAVCAAAAVPTAHAQPERTRSGHAHAQSAPSESAGPGLRVLSHNVFLFSKLLHPNWGQDHRAAQIPRQDWFHGNDAVVLQEAFDNSSSDALLENAADRYPHRTPVLGRSRDGWDATHGAYSGASVEDGGVAVLSKWPIVRSEQYVYEEGCGIEALSQKGFVYTVLDVAGSNVHLVGTHTQSTDPGCAQGRPAEVRSAQFRELSAFLDRKEIPADEQVLVAGDFNVDSRSDEYPRMLADAGLADVDSRSGLPYSFDTEDNSVAADRYPDDPRENLDHVLHREGHARPQSWDNEVVAERSVPWTVRSWGKEYTYTNLSDHYPVVGG